MLKLRAAPAAKNVLDAIEVLRGMNTDNARKLPADAPTGFIKPRWQKLVMTDAGIDRRYYELCALSELKNSLRSGDIWVQGSRQFKDFEDYLVPPEKFTSLKQSSELPLAVATDCEQYLHERLTLLEAQLATVNRMAAANDLPDAIITESGLKITPLDAAVPDTAQALIDQTAMVLPHVKITELLLEVDEWTGFTRHFTHLKSGDLAKDKNLLLTTILADAINLGLTKMAESCPGTTYAKLAWLQAGIPATKRTRQRWLNWSTLSFGIPLPGTGAMAPHHHRTDRISEPLARQRARGTSTQNMAAAQDGLSTPTSPTNTRHSTPRWSMSACATQPTCSTACCTTNPTCGSRSTTPTRRASPITSSP